MEEKAKQLALKDCDIHFKDRFEDGEFVSKHVLSAYLKERYNYWMVKLNNHEHSI